MKNRSLIVKLLMTGGLIAVLAYLFHPESGQFALTVNGHPIADPLARLAAIPTLLVVMLVTIFLGLLLFFGVGLVLFLSTLFVSFLFVAFLAPFFWPVLLIVLVLILLMSAPWPKN
jgi:hypothetical protein